MPVFYEEIVKINDNDNGSDEGSKDEEEWKAPKSAVKLSAPTSKSSKIW